ncbi:MAG: DUF262 domain-containing protein [Candidatus Zeuxoniibacter abyssi]|nr:MAG: DUF262 domain-containing protein [Candidatus Persebacteraceae bacterium AB1(2)]
MTNETFKPTHDSVSEIFGNKNSFYKIPNYQRPYNWESEQVEQMWDDLYEAYKGDDIENYFLGSIIVTPSEDGYFDVIDGQQRITTLIILFCCAANATSMSPSTVEEVKDAVQASVGKKIRLKLITEINQQIHFEQEIVNNNDLHNIRANKRIRKDNKYINTAIIFNEKIKKINNELEGFIRYILDKTTLIKIHCTNKSFAIKLFQVLNDRGLDLTQADLVKSFLLEKLEEEDREKFISNWKDIKRGMDFVNTTMEGILGYYEYYLLASNPKKSLSDEIANWIKKNDTSPDACPDAFIHKLSQFSKYYIEIIDDDTKTYSFNYLPHQIYHWPILTAAKKHMSNDDYEVLRDKLAGFYYSYWIAGYTASRIKQVSFNIIDIIKKGEGINKTMEELDKKINDDRVNERCCDNLNNSAYGERWLRPLLVAIEYQQTDDSKSDFIKLDKKLHVEHILPKDKKHHDTYNFDNGHKNMLINLLI